MHPRNGYTGHGHYGTVCIDGTVSEKNRTVQCAEVYWFNKLEIRPCTHYSIDYMYLESSTSITVYFPFITMYQNYFLKEV